MKGKEKNNITGNRLRELRVSRSLSQKALARLLNVDRTAVVCWENGTNRPVRKLKELTALFGVTADYLMGIDKSAMYEPVQTPIEPSPPTRDDVIQAFTNLLDVAEGYLANR